MIARLLVARRPLPPRLFFCEGDGWRFDPRYTQGRCPICGWAPPGAPSMPRWMQLANRVDWELFGLFALADVLVLVGLVVAHAAGLLPMSGRP